MKLGNYAFVYLFQFLLPADTGSFGAGKCALLLLNCMLSLDADRCAVMAVHRWFKSNFVWLLVRLMKSLREWRFCVAVLCMHHYGFIYAIFFVLAVV